MGEVRDHNIKNRTYYYFDDMIDIRKFELNFLKIDKKPYKHFNIYYIGYITIKKLLSEFMFFPLMLIYYEEKN